MDNWVGISWGFDLSRPWQPAQQVGSEDPTWDLSGHAEAESLSMLVFRRSIHSLWTKAWFYGCVCWKGISGLLGRFCRNNGLGDVGTGRAIVGRDTRATGDRPKRVLRRSNFGRQCRALFDVTF